MEREGSICKPSSEVSPETDPDGTLIVDFQPQGLGGNTILLTKPPAWRFIMAPEDTPEARNRPRGFEPYPCCLYVSGGKCLLALNFLICEMGRTMEPAPLDRLSHHNPVAENSEHQLLRMPPHTAQAGRRHSCCSKSVLQKHGFKGGHRMGPWVRSANHGAFQGQNGAPCSAWKGCG